jgi:hypothetical protein
VHGETAFVEVRGEMGEVFVMANFTSAATVDEIEFVCNAPDTCRLPAAAAGLGLREIRALKGLPSLRNRRPNAASLRPATSRTSPPSAP